MLLYCIRVKENEARWHSGLGFFGSFFPLFVSIFYFEPQNKRLKRIAGLENELLKEEKKK